jgi:hypothetical protein
MKPLYLIILILCPLLAVTQSKPSAYDKFISCRYYNIDTTNKEIHEVLNTWKKYLVQRINGFEWKIDTAGYYYWNEEEKQLYREPDLVLAYEPYLCLSKTDILSIEPLENGFYQILNVKGLIEDTSLQQFKTQAIFYVLAKKAGQNFKLYNYFYLEKSKMKQALISNVFYYYPPDYKFSKRKAGAFVSFEDSLSVLFKIPKPGHIHYLLENDNEALMKRLGFFFYPTGTSRHGGHSIFKDIFLLSSFDENHRHELVHYFTSATNPGVIGFFDEGLATYFGGTIGNDLNWHIGYVKNYLKDKPDLDLTNENQFGYIDGKTNPQYVLGAIIIKYTIDKFGFPKVLAMLQYSKKKYNYKEVIEKELGIKQSDLNSFCRHYLTGK